jgi:cell wall-associated NlpC family hydrolase
VTRKTRGAAVAILLMLAGAPSAMAAEPTGGTTAAGTTAPADGTGTATTADGTASPTTPSTTISATATVSLSRSQTKLVQRRVHVPADGAVGARTRSAIRKYQGARSLTRTGRPNLETIKAMKLPFAAQVERKLATRSAATGTATTPAAPAPAQGTVAGALAAARSAIGTPYLSGGTTTAGFDCSGLTQWAYAQAGIDLERTSFDQYAQGTAVEQDAIQAGDLVFFSTAGPGASHVGIATSATTVISATSHGVMEHQITDSYWGPAYVGARRVAA